MLHSGLCVHQFSLFSRFNKPSEGHRAWKMLGFPAAESAQGSHEKLLKDLGDVLQGVCPQGSM